MKKAKNTNLSFEEALLNLETIVKSLEKGDLPLEDSLTKFSEGVALSRFCLTKLNAAEEHMDKILQTEEGQLVEKPLEL